jgi:hypothetical protein
MPMKVQKKVIFGGSFQVGLMNIIVIIKILKSSVSIGLVQMTRFYDVIVTFEKASTIMHVNNYNKTYVAVIRNQGGERGTYLLMTSMMTKKGTKERADLCSRERRVPKVDGVDNRVWGTTYPSWSEHRLSLHYTYLFSLKLRTTQ